MMKLEVSSSILTLIPRAYHDVYKIFKRRLHENSDKIEDIYKNNF